MMYELVKTLTELDGPTGYEDDVQGWLAERWRSNGLQVQRTAIGNLVARLGGEGRRLLIGAHADEISFRVKSVDGDGFLWLSSGRGMSDRPPVTVPLGHIARVFGRAGAVEGTFAGLTGHVMSNRQRADYAARPLDWNDLYVDVGARSQEEVTAMKIHPGHPVINVVTTRRNGRNIVGKAMDDRAGLAIITAMLERVDRSRLQYEVWLTSTSMEEIGLVGARSIIRGFDLAIAVEVGLAGDSPLVDRREMPVSLGKGPVLVHGDNETAYSRDLTNALILSAETHDIPVQHAMFQHFSSDAREWVQEGIPSAMLAFPCRHTHSPYETVQESDLEQAADLLRTFVTTSSG